MRHAVKPGDMVMLRDGTGPYLVIEAGKGLRNSQGAMVTCEPVARLANKDGGSVTIKPGPCAFDSGWVMQVHCVPAPPEPVVFTSLHWWTLLLAAIFCALVAWAVA